MDNYMNYGGQPAAPNWNGGQGSYISGMQNGMNPMGQRMMPQSQTIQRPTIPGRIVRSINEVAPGEIPMDGNATYFPTNDGEIIHACYWTRDGKIETVNYIRQKPESIEKSVAVIPNEEALSMIMGRLDEMQKEIKRISRPRHRNNTFDKQNQLSQEKEVEQNV